MLETRSVPYRYREYTQDPLSAAELEEVFGQLGMRPKELLRKNDRAYRELGLEGEGDDAVLIGHMADHPTLLQRPIAVLRGRAILGRPAERILELLA